MLMLLIARLAARGRREGPADERVVSSTAAGPAGAGTSGVRARKAMVRETEPNIVSEMMSSMELMGKARVVDAA